MKLIIVYGTRPEFLKLKMLIDTIRNNFDIIATVIKINQHINLIEDNGYYDILIDISEICEDRINNIGANILSKLPTYLKDCTHVLVQGDTATCYYALLSAYQIKKQCIHLEAGMRTYNLEHPYPEEGYRQMISRITNIHLCPSEEEKENLIKEKVTGKIFVVGNTILDLVKSYNIPVTNKNNALITLHRRENWDNYREYILTIFEFAKKYSHIDFYFLTHPNPLLRKIIDEINIDNSINNLKIMDPILHKELIQILSTCLFVITDSGGIQEEANFLGKHIFMLRKITERNAINKNKITIVNQNNILDIDIKEYHHEYGYEYGDGQSVNKIYQILKNI